MIHRIMDTKLVNVYNDAKTDITHWGRIAHHLVIH